MRRLVIFLGLLLSVLVLSNQGAQAQTAGKVVLGRYAQVRYATGIHASPNAGSRTYYHTQANQYLVVRPLNDTWCQVMMERGIWGYGLIDAIEIMPFEVIADQPTAPMRGLSSRSRSAVANYSLNFIGTPYKWGGNDETAGIDCSGFVKKMYGKIGIDLPRTAAEQALVGQPIFQIQDLRSGDRLYFWDKKRGKIGHTGLYLGAGKFVHSSSGHKGVATDDLHEERWRKILVAARR